MDDNQQTSAPDFSDIPALGDTQGLENYLNNEALAAQGLPTEQPAAPEQPNEQTQQPAQTAQTAQQTQQNPNPNTITLTREQLNAILASRGQVAQQPQQRQSQVQRQPSYSAQEQQFIINALSRGFSLEQINQFLMQQKSGASNNAAMQRVAQIEQYLREQEYKAAETAFINKLSDFGDKWGLSEQDLVTFGNEALKHGINIASDNINLEMVFRAIYPDQYAIRSRRMTPTNSSQIYGGTNIPEGSRASASKLEDAYVENFLRGAMPNQYGMLNKK